MAINQIAVTATDEAAPIKMYVLLIWPCCAAEVQCTCSNLRLIVPHLNLVKGGEPRSQQRRGQPPNPVGCLLDSKQAQLSWSSPVSVKLASSARISQFTVNMWEEFWGGVKVSDAERQGSVEVAAASLLFFTCRLSRGEKDGLEIPLVRKDILLRYTGCKNGLV